MNQIFLETRMFRLSDGEEIMTLAFFILIQYRSVSDGPTDRRTDGRTDIPPLAIPAVCIARYANALVKIGRDAIVDHVVTYMFGDDRLYNEKALTIGVEDGGQGGKNILGQLLCKIQTFFGQKSCKIGKFCSFFGQI